MTKNNECSAVSPGISVYTKDMRMENKKQQRKLEVIPSQISLEGDTIAAIVTAMGGQQGAVAIVRLSGSSAIEITSRLFRPSRRVKDTKTYALGAFAWSPQTHHVEYGTLVDTSGALVDEV